MASATILDFCNMLILMPTLATGSHFQLLYQIWCKYTQKWPSYGHLTDFRMVAILNLLPVSVFVFLSFAHL